MTSRRHVVRFAVAAVLAIAALCSASALSVYALESSDAYGEIPVPGTGTVHLPAGEIVAAFAHSDDGRHSNPDPGPEPEPTLWLTGPASAPEPRIVADRGRRSDDGTSTHVQLWRITVGAEGDYDATVAGDASGYPQPRIAFGRTSSGVWLWALGGLLFVAVMVAVSIGGANLTALLLHRKS